MGHASSGSSFQHTAGDVPYENYQKKNLKKSGTTYKKMQKDPFYDRKALADNFRDKKGSLDGKGAGYGDSSSSSSSFSKSKDSSAGGGQKDGYGGTGLDILHVTLDAMHKDKDKDKDKDKNGVSKADRKSSKKLDIAEVSRKGKKTKQNPHGLTDDFWEQTAPECSGHQMPGKLLIVKKDGPNKGRRFYGCCFPADQRCKFFMWAEENPDVLPLLLELEQQKVDRGKSVFADTQKARGRSTTLADTNPEEEPEEDWKHHAIAQYMQRLDDMNIDDLKAEVAMCKKRR